MIRFPRMKIPLLRLLLLLDHAGQNTVDLSAIEILVLDEADRMLDMGFVHDIRKVLALLPGRRQNLLFSATYSAEVRQLADSLLHKPAHIEVARHKPAAETVEQFVYRVNRSDKRELLIHLIEDGEWDVGLRGRMAENSEKWLLLLISR